MKIMTYNLKHSIKEDIFGLWRKRYKKMLKYILDTNPDIIGVQELTRKGKRYLKNNLLDYNIIGKSRHSIILSNEYNCLLIKKDYKINEHATFSLSDRPEKLGRKAKTDNFPRICSLAHIEKNKIKYFVINTHLDNSDKENKKRLLDIFENIISKYKKEDELIVIVGDFNMSIKNKNLVNFSEKYKDPFKDNKISSCIWVPQLPSIDHIFLDKNLNYNNELIDTSMNISDHYPLICEIERK